MLHGSASGSSRSWSAISSKRSAGAGPSSPRAGHRPPLEAGAREHRPALGLAARGRIAGEQRRACGLEVRRTVSTTTLRAPAPARPPRVARLDLLELGEQVLRHPDRGGVDQPAVERDSALPVRRGLAHRLDDAAGALHEPRGRRVDLVRERHLRGVDRPLALVPEHRRAARGRDVALGVGEVAVRAVDRPQAVGPAGHRDPRERVVPLVAPVAVALIRAVRVGEHRVVLVHAADRRRVALDRGRVVGHAEDHRLHPVRARLRDLVHVDHPDRGLDEHGQADPALEAHRLLDLREEGGHRGARRRRRSPWGSRSRPRARPPAPRRRRCRGSTSGCRGR